MQIIIYNIYNHKSAQVSNRGSGCDIDDGFRQLVPHREVPLGVLFAGKPLVAEFAGEWLRLDVRSPMDVQTAALRELLAASVARVRPITGVRPFVRSQVTGARELALAPLAGV